MFRIIYDQPHLEAPANHWLTLFFVFYHGIVGERVAQLFMFYLRARLFVLGWDLLVYRRFACSMLGKMIKQIYSPNVDSVHGTMPPTGNQALLSRIMKPTMIFAINASYQGRLFPGVLRGIGGVPFLQDGPVLVINGAKKTL